MPSTAPDCLVVAVGVLIENRRVLVAQRPAGVHLGGLWEFPGGKIESDETAEVALSREFREELGIDLLRVMRLMELDHAYAGRSVNLCVFTIEEYLGSPEGKEGQRIDWCGPEELGLREFPAANTPILDYVRGILAAD